MRRELIAVMIVLVVLALMLSLPVQADRLVVQPTGIAAVSPEGAAGLALSVRLAPLANDNYLWLELGAISQDVSAWHGFSGLSSEIRLVQTVTRIMDRGGIGYDWSTHTVLLYMTTDFSSLF